MVRLADEHAPPTVRVAAAIMASAALILSVSFFVPISGRRFVSVVAARPVVLYLVVVLLLAWSVARLNGAAYLLTIMTAGLGLLPPFVYLAVAVIGLTKPTPLIAASTTEQFMWLAMAVVLVLLVTRSSIKAPWGLLNGFSR